MNQESNQGLPGADEASTAKRLEHLKQLAHRREEFVQQLQSDRERISAAQRQFVETVQKLAYFTAQEAASQATAPFDAWLEAERQVTDAADRYARLLNAATSKTTRLPQPYDEFASRIQALYSSRNHIETMRDIAHYFWWSVGRNTAAMIGFWSNHDHTTDSGSHTLKRLLELAAEAQYVEPDVEPVELEPPENIHYDEFSPARFIDRVTELAYYMWVYNGRRAGTTLLDYWSHAVHHLSAVIVEALRDADTALDAGQKIAEALASFSPHLHMKPIQERAYELWLQDGKMPGRELDYWVDAEQEKLSRMSGESAMKPKRGR